MICEQNTNSPLLCDCCGRDINDNNTFDASACDACGPPRVWVRKIIIWAIHGKSSIRKLGPVIAYRRTSAEAYVFAQGREWDGSEGYCERIWALQAGEDVWVLGFHDPIDLDGGYSEAREEVFSDIRDTDIRPLVGHKQTTNIQDKDVRPLIVHKPATNDQVGQIANMLQSWSTDRLAALAAFIAAIDTSILCNSRPER